MSPSDAATPRRRGWVIALFCLLTLGSIMLFAPSGELYVDADGNPHVPGFFNDAVITYADQISGAHEVTDWHCALYMYEGRALHHAMEWVSGAECDGILPQRILMWVADIVLLANLAYWLALLMRRDARLGWIAVPFGGCMVLLHIGLGVSLDYFFTTILCSSLSLSFMLYRAPGKWVRLLCAVGLVILLWHMVEYRRNAALLLPGFVYLLTARYMPGARIFSKAALAAVFTLALYWTATNSIRLSGLTVEHKPSMTPMVESDLRIAALLTDSREQEWENLRANGMPVYEHEYRDSITAYWGGADVNKTDWERVWPYYLNAWKTNTGNMLMARFLQLSQFYWSGTTPAIVENLADAMYPAMQHNPQRWVTLRPTDMQYTYLRVLRLAVTLGTIILCLRLLYLWLVRRVALSACQYVQLIVTGAASAYSVSYVVVTPTADFRYLLPAQVLGFFVFFLMALQAYLRRKDSCA